MPKTIADYHRMLLSGETTVKAVVLECMEKIEKDNARLNIFLTVNDKAIEEAEKMDQLFAADKSILERKPLFGVPVGHKDIFSTKGMRTTAASKVLEEYVPSFNATVVEKLNDAGVIIMGKLNCDAWAHGSSGENSDFGPTLNPVDETRVPGGSSSGSAAAVAAGMVMVSTATDTGGSIRLPANFTGTVGLKPTYGRVSRYGVIAMASSLDSIGHVTRNIEDNAKVFEVTSAPDIYDANTADSRPFKFEQGDVAGLKIGIPSEYVKTLKDEDVLAAFNKSVERLKNMGVEIVEVSLPYTDKAAASYYILQPAEVSSNLARFDGVRFGKGRTAFGPEAVRRMLIGAYTLSSGYYDAYYKKALKVRTLIKQDFDQVFQGVDLLVCPVSPTPPFKLGEKISDPVSMYLSDILTIPMNLAGIPSLALPYGQTTEGLPLGFQIVGPRYSEELIYKVASAFEKHE